MLKPELNELFEIYRPSPKYPTYPPYHQGHYLEDYFYYNYRNIDKKRLYIPVFWTTCYIENRTNGLQKAIDKLDKSEPYFVVSQHDDAIKERLPPDTIHFNAGGNIRSANNIPIPLVCSRIPITVSGDNNRDILASFIGSNTHPIRSLICDKLSNNDAFIISNKQWSPHVDDQSYNYFISTALRSKYLLCPRGYGVNSFRLYESFQLGCVPVIITDDPYLPWVDEVDWSKISVLISPHQVSDLQYILENITDSKRAEMLSEGAVIYEKYLTLNAVFHNILKRIS